MSFFPFSPLQPRDKKTLRPSAFVPLRRELVFDIDMTDYDEIRTCCQDKDMCKRCWGFIAAATGVLDSALRGELRLLLPSLAFLLRVLILSLLRFGSRSRAIRLLPSSLGLLWSTRNSLLGFRHRCYRPDGRPTSSYRPLLGGRRWIEGYE